PAVYQETKLARPRFFSKASLYKRQSRDGSMLQNIVSGIVGSTSSSQCRLWANRSTEIWATVRLPQMTQIDPPTPSEPHAKSIARLQAQAMPNRTRQYGEPSLCRYSALPLRRTS